MTASRNVRDALIEHDIRVRRAIGGQQRAIAGRQADLERRVLAALEEIDPAGAPTELQRAKRMTQFEQRVKELAQEIYGSHSIQGREALQGVALAESNAVTGAIEESI